MGITERKEKQKAELKNLILEASIRLFSEEGYEGFSIRKIADRIEYSPTTVYLYYKDKNEILFELHEIGFRRFAGYNQELHLVTDPLRRLHKLGENYIRFGLENPEFYNLMFILPAPMEVIECKKECEWKGGEDALEFLKSIISECIGKGIVASGDVNTIAMAIWGMVHGLVSLAIRQRFSKLVPEEEVVPTMNKALDWLISTVNTTNPAGSLKSNGM